MKYRQIKKIFILFWIGVCFLIMPVFAQEDTLLVLKDERRTGLEAWQVAYQAWVENEGDSSRSRLLADEELIKANLAFFRSSAEELLSEQELVNDDILQLQQRTGEQVEYLNRVLVKNDMNDVNSISVIESDMKANWESLQGVSRIMMAKILLVQIKIMRTYLDNRMDEIDVRILAAQNVGLKSEGLEQSYSDLLQRYADVTKTFTQVQSLWGVSDGLDEETLRQGLQLLSASEETLEQVSSIVPSLASQLDLILKGSVPLVPTDTVPSTAAATTTESVDMDFLNKMATGSPVTTTDIISTTTQNISE